MQYKIVLGTILGDRDGSLLLHFSDNKIFGILRLLGFSTDVSGEMDAPEHAVFRGVIKTFLSEEPFTAIGKLTENLLDMKLKTEQHTYSLKGKRTPEGSEDETD